MHDHRRPHRLGRRLDRHPLSCSHSARPRSHYLQAIKLISFPEPNLRSTPPWVPGIRKLEFRASFAGHLPRGSLVRTIGWYTRPISQHPTDSSARPRAFPKHLPRGRSVSSIGFPAGDRFGRLPVDATTHATASQRHTRRFGTWPPFTCRHAKR